MKDYLINQNWQDYTESEHEMWRTLFKRQEKVLEGRVVPVFLDGVRELGMAASGIPRFEALSDILKQRTGWEVVAVPGLVPDDVFFRLLAEKKFPSTCFIRKPEQIDYLQEPDIFHDVFGHVPLLINPIFADYMQYYGEAGLKALGQDCLHRLARLYWYTVEFGLIQTDEGLRTYGAGIVSSYSETIYCVEDPKPNRIMFDLKRVMRTNYRIDDFQETYFVVPSFESLFDATKAQDFHPIYNELAPLPDFAANEVLKCDELVLI
ncbi:phenylalanine 4-monooxygenase [Candidatus Paracaedibacter symbiosus]|uniref:phenylalanine 4-monooxygenase n=1 Tax=Candidatus Paracaedibacter symbiosus TaxID=244582 RepID=UPI000509D7AD|nr:phenylalanine 4-monooxygenase [Candidatus Paracaedibacter symbiosus]